MQACSRSTSASPTVRNVAQAVKTPALSKKSIPEQIDTRYLNKDNLFQGIQALQFPCTIENKVFTGITEIHTSTQDLSSLPDIVISNLRPNSLILIIQSFKENTDDIIINTILLDPDNLENELIKIGLRFDEDVLEIESRYVCKSLRQQSIATRLTLNIIKALEISVDESYEVWNESSHIATTLFFYPLHKFQLDQKDIPDDFELDSTIDLKRFNRKPATYSAKQFVENKVKLDREQDIKCKIIQNNGKLDFNIENLKKLRVLLKQYALRDTLESTLL